MSRGATPDDSAQQSPEFHCETDDHMVCGAGDGAVTHLIGEAQIESLQLSDTIGIYRTKMPNVYVFASSGENFNRGCALIGCIQSFPFLRSERSMHPCRHNYYATTSIIFHTETKPIAGGVLSIKANLLHLC